MAILDRESLKKQQQALKDLGYYSGAIDGIWSLKSMEAKIEFERSGKFSPGIPNKGMPFNVNSKLPSSMKLDNTGNVIVRDSERAIEPQIIETTVTPREVTPPIVDAKQAAQGANANRNNKHNQQKAQLPEVTPAIVTVDIKDL